MSCIVEIVRTFVLILFFFLLAAPASASTLTQQSVVSWKTSYKSQDRASFVVPGIGRGEIVCRRNTTWIRITPSNRSRETQMWTTKYETKNGVVIPAVRNARVYRYAHALDIFDSGTGSSAYEGFNQENHVENYSVGYMHGIISSRPGRNTAANAAQTPSPTTFDLSWEWNDFHNKDKSSCTVRATFKTDVSGQEAKTRKTVKSKTRKVSVNGQTRHVGTKAFISKTRSRGLTLDWHGAADAKTTSKDLTLPGFGTLRVSCDTGANATIWFYPKADGDFWVETAQGEGEEIIFGDSYTLDPITRSLGPIPLPENGMLRGFLHVDGRNAQMRVSSVRKTNDLDSRLNFCETSVYLVEDA